jgi:LPXTG-motif cell wall-anchored protein
MTQGRNPEQEPAHDVLAAEAFAVPAADPRLRSRPFSVPDDPSGIAEPHDILAAEEFAMPAASRETEPTTLARGAESPWWTALGAAAALLAVVGFRRRRRVT